MSNRLRSQAGDRPRTGVLWPGKWTVLVLCVLVGAGLCLGPARPVLAEASVDVVLLADLSTSMRELFPEVRERLLQEIDRAHVGDRVVLVTFGEGAHLLARRRVRGPADRAYLRAIVQGLSPTQRATYVTQGLDRGFSELEALFADAPDRERRLLWLTDGKNNPPAFLGDNVLTLADLRNKHEGVRPDGAWFAFDAPLGAGAGTEFLDFLEWARRTLFHLYVRETEVALGAHPDRRFGVDRSIQFKPQNSALQGLEFLVLARVVRSGGDPGQQFDLAVEPSTVLVQPGPWEEQFHFAYEGAPGTYSGYLIFESYARESFLVQPERLPLTFTIEAPAPPPEAETETPDLVAEAVDPVLQQRGRRVGFRGPQQPLELGPVAPGKSFKDVITFQSNAPVNPDQVQVQTTIPLPDGWTLDTVVTGRDPQTLSVEVRLQVPAIEPLPDALLVGTAFHGSIRLQTDQPGIELLPPSRELYVLLPVPTRVGRPADRAPAAGGPAPSAEQTIADTLANAEETATRMLGGDSAAPAPPARQPSPSVFTVARRYAPWAGLAILVGAGVWLLRFLRRRRFESTEFFGEFVVIKDPGRRKLRTLRLQDVGAATGHQTLVVGAAPRSDIRLPHASVADLHARLTTERSNGSVHVVLYPARGAEIRINDEPCTDERPLMDKDLVSFGDYLFLFSAPEPQPEVVVHFVDGSVLRGTIREWSLAEPTFELLAFTGDDVADVAHVRFADLKAVFFLRPGAGEVPLGMGIPSQLEAGRNVVVEFADGETLRGSVLADYTDYADRFFILPDAHPGLAAVLVERVNAAAIRVSPGTNGTTVGAGGRRRSRSN